VRPNRLKFSQQRVLANSVNLQIAKSEIRKIAYDLQLRANTIL